MNAALEMLPVWLVPHHATVMEILTEMRHRLDTEIRTRNADLMDEKKKVAA